MSGRKRLLIDSLVLLVLPLAGAAAIALGGLGQMHYDSVLFPPLRRGVEGFNILTVFYLAVVGWTAAAVSRLPSWIIGPAALALMPVWSSAEMALAPTSHNLWPFEWAFYALASLVPFIAAWICWRRREWLAREGP
jgi:hypothetical protein